MIIPMSAEINSMKFEISVMPFGGKTKVIINQRTIVKRKIRVGNGSNDSKKKEKKIF